MYIRVRVIPESREEKVIKKTDDHFVISVKAKAKGNAANKRLIEMLIAMYPGMSVRIINGHHHPTKLIAID